MTVGGCDVVIKTRKSSEYVFERAIYVIRMVWPQYVLEDGDTGEVINIADAKWADGLRGVRELMIYRDAVAKAEWDDTSPKDPDPNSMIHVLRTYCDRVSVVVGDGKNQQMADIINGLRAVLEKKQ